ncbi:MAG: bifunctional diaminohydroxyphosphoribosylaminopyrimidine deaminase/5-amino-6-(5-phosphoribosylamino)uracil reductase RibD [Candidatus Dormibacteraeota bacterium]|nr:bifunctional diaminohydroxyphosphoribosylaminopyrimidine deaminase/5-amino-6-(5-phosphoribosylamino)uracil reductase RibD [Candidatus Dormibacteraeota bacterium]
MGRALELAARARHLTSPNPMVGAIVLDGSGEFAGEGFHARSGEPHAETLAMERAGARARGGTLYVTLEPCSHQGRTAPCADAVVAAGVTRVVVAMEDPDRRVAGGGIRRMREAGISVEVGLEEEAARRLNRFYVKQRTTGLPWVTARFAASLDGKIATATGESRWITSEAARLESHRLREQHDAILVGAGTVAADDPELSNRLPEAARQPLRVVLDSKLRTPLTAKVLAGLDRQPTLVVTTPQAGERAIAALGKTGAEVVTVDAAGPEQRVDLAQLLKLLGDRGLLSVLVEGGGEVTGAFFDSHLVDGVVAFLAPLIIGGKEAPGAVGGKGARQLADAFRLTNLEMRRIGDDILVSGECSPG